MHLDNASYESINDALEAAAESGGWAAEVEVTVEEPNSSEIITVRPSERITHRVGEIESIDDDGIYRALDQGVPLDVIMALVASAGSNIGY
jgi:hypothetical protein